jgi:hypothetical protein
MELTAELARKLFTYDPEEGVLRWAVVRRRGGSIGDVAGSMTNGARQVEVNGRAYLVHRVIWLMMTGRWPKQLIDHRNRNRSDNRWCNLRDVSRTVNAENIGGANRNNQSGLLGASFCRWNGRWRSQITINGKKVHLGYFDTAEEAHDKHVWFKRWFHEGCEI